MRRFITGAISIFAVLFIGAVLVGLVLPQGFTIERQVTVEASKERVYALIGDLENWPTWGPWQDADASLVITMGDKTSGIGASQRWVGKDGNGRLVFTAADPERGVEFDLLFNDDAFGNTSSIVYREEGEGLVVTWTMSGEVSVPVLGGYLAKMMPGMVAPMFENGLEKLKAESEKG